MWAVIGAVAGLLVGVLIAWFLGRRSADKRIAAIEAEWSKRWRFEEARLMGRVKVAEDERDAVAAGRDAAWWKWLEALAVGKIPLAEAMRNAPAPRPSQAVQHSGNLRARAGLDEDLHVEVDDTAHASK
jgi:hypothetical protein